MTMTITYTNRCGRAILILIDYDVIQGLAKFRRNHTEKIIRYVIDT